MTNNIEYLNKVTALYTRLSSDDEQQGDSNSIAHQKEILQDFAQSKGFSNIQFYVDDGYSGTTFNRPGFNKLLEDVDNELISTIIVKDLSRLGRNYLQVGYYTDVIFPDSNVRFISVTDGYDSIKGYDEFMPFKNLMNDWYARDISKKQRAVIKSKGNAGKRLITRPIYGYKHNEDKTNWIIDEEVSPVVKKIYQLYLDGYGIQMIANYLFAKKIENPYTYKGYHQSEETKQNPYLWSCQTIIGILTKQEYCGDTINFKTTARKSTYGTKKIINTPDKLKVFYDTHPAIISHEEFEAVQELRKKNKRVRTRNQEKQIFEDLIYCYDCKSKMYIQKSTSKTKQVNYICSLFRKNQTCPCSHYVPYHLLYDNALSIINKILNNDDFIKTAKNTIKVKNTKQKNKINKNLSNSKKRIKEIDKYLVNLYEDKVKGNISLDIFNTLSNEYNDEKKQLNDFILNHNYEIAEISKDNKGIKQFTSIVNKYKGASIEKLTYEVAHDFIEKIEVHASVKVDGKRTQQLDIYLNGIGLVTD